MQLPTRYLKIILIFTIGVFPFCLFPIAVHGASVAIPQQVTELARRVVAADTHKITYIRIRPPSLPLLPPPPTPRPLTTEEQSTLARLAEKSYVTLNITATVYLGGICPVTKLRWRDANGELSFVAWSNVDFRHLTQIHQFETENTVYAWFPFVDEIVLAEWPSDQPQPIPADLQFAPGFCEYYLNAETAGLKSEETILAGLDYLHAYAQLNATQLKADFELRLAEAAAREKRLREHPPKTPDTVIHFWPVQSHLNPR